MSAFDIAGAVVATPLAIGCLWGVIWSLRRPLDRVVVFGATGTIGPLVVVWAAFCIARMFGATL